MAKKLILLILFYISPCVLTQEQVPAISRKKVDLECELNSTQNVIWNFDIGNIFTDIYTCNNISVCTHSGRDVGPQPGNSNVSRSNETSTLSLHPSKDETYQCQLGDHVVKTYNIYLIEPTEIKAYCNDSLQHIINSEDLQIQFSCGYNFERALTLNGKLTLDGLGPNNLNVQNSSKTIDASLPLDDNFNNINDAHCDIHFPDIDVTRTCTYPAISKTQYVVEGNGIIVESTVSLNVDWYLFGKDGTEEYISNRSWTRDEGRSLLIRGITEEDVGKVVVWRTIGADNLTNNGTIGFAVISDISGDSPNKPESKDPNTTTSSDDDPFFVLTLLFLALWLITLSVGGIILFCREKKLKTSTSGNVKSPNSNQSSNVKPNGNVSSGEHGTPLVRFTTEATNPDISNTNNSAHTPVLEQDDGNDDTLNRQSQGDSHLYFTLEKSPSFRRASASRWNPGDANPATLDQDQGRHWQGYATVGESNENATCSYDIGEYAEVGEHLLGKGPPVQSIRPPVRKKPGREEVKEDDISKLYGKVNK